MEIYERIKELRKNHLKLSQAAFGEKLGVSRDVIKNIELNALARPDQKLSLIKLMCKEFNVNEDWILNGTEPMFIESDTFSLDEFVQKNGMTDVELSILKSYFEMDPDVRKMLLDSFKKGLLCNTNNESSATVQSSKLKNIKTAKTDDDIDEELAAYRQELEAEKKGTTSSASGE